MPCPDVHMKLIESEHICDDGTLNASTSLMHWGDSVAQVKSMGPTKRMLGKLAMAIWVNSSP